MEQQKFAYEKIENGIRILRCYGNSGCVKIPEQIEGQPVTELAAYAFAKEMDSEPENNSGLSCICGEDLEELHLPETVKRLGRYIFYNCIQFKKFFFYNNIDYMGAGAFTGCEKLSYLYMQEVIGEKSCLREILSDLKQEVQVKVFQGETCIYELVYPEFFEEAEENTPARIINTVTHGMGIQYRNAFRDTKVIFREYDKLFEAGKYNIEAATGIEMAAARLAYPVELEEAARKDYIIFLKEHLKQAAEAFIKEEEQEKLRWLAENFITTKEEMDILLKQAAEKEQAEMISMLMDIKHQRFSQKKKKFSL